MTTTKKDLELIAFDLIDMDITRRKDIEMVATLTDEEMKQLMKIIRSK